MATEDDTIDLRFLGWRKATESSLADRVGHLSVSELHAWLTGAQAVDEPIDVLRQPPAAGNRRGQRSATDASGQSAEQVAIYRFQGDAMPAIHGPTTDVQADSTEPPAAADAATILESTMSTAS